MAKIQSIARIGQHQLVNAGGAVVSSHSDPDDAYARLTGLPPGTYTLRIADKRVVTIADGGSVPVPILPSSFYVGSALIG